MACLYFGPHVLSKRSNACSAASRLGAPYTSFKSTQNAFRSFHTTYLQLLRIWCTMQSWVMVFGNTPLMASVKPLRLSVQAIRISSTPLAFKSVSTLIQKEADSVSAIHI